jgi:hypothetical protein
VQVEDGVERRWAQIEAVAAALFEAETLSGPDVERISAKAQFALLNAALTDEDVSGLPGTARRPSTPPLQSTAPPGRD